MIKSIMILNLHYTKLQFLFAPCLIFIFIGVAIFNPIAYGILRLSQLQGWDFYPTPQKTMLKLFDWFEIWYT